MPSTLFALVQCFTTIKSRAKTAPTFRVRSTRNLGIESRSDGERTWSEQSGQGPASMGQRRAQQVIGGKKFVVRDRDIFGAVRAYEEGTRHFTELFSFIE